MILLTMTLLQVTREMEGRAVECRATNSAGTAASTAAVIRIKCRSTAGYQVYQHTDRGAAVLAKCMSLSQQNIADDVFNTSYYLFRIRGEIRIEICRRTFIMDR